MENDILKAIKDLDKRLDGIDRRLDGVVSDMRQITSHISRIDGNIEIIATATGFPYEKEKRLVESFHAKVG